MEDNVLIIANLEEVGVFRSRRVAFKQVIEKIIKQFYATVTEMTRN